MPITEMTPSQAEQIRQHCQADPSFFFKNLLGTEFWQYQAIIAESVRDNRITGIASCHDTGKTFTAARIAVWYLITHPESIVVTTAPTWRQVKDFLWREIRTAYDRAPVPLSRRDPNVTGWEIANNWYAVGLSTKDPDKFQGYHADSGNQLVIADEAAGIEEPMFEAIDAVLTSEMCRLLMIGNPTSSSGTFRDAFREGSGVAVMQISCWNTPNFTANKIRNEDDLIKAIETGRELAKPAPYLISPIWVYERIKKWGIESPMYQARVLGQFPSMASDTLIPLNWIELAMEPERALEVEAGADIYGVDVARFGDDRTVVLHRRGDVVQPLQTYHMQDTMQTADRIHAILKNEPQARAYVDVVGLGAGVVDRLHQLHKQEMAADGTHRWTKVAGVNVGEKPDETYSKQTGILFANKRAELYWRLREKFEKGTIALPHDEELANELSLIKYKFNPDGKLWIEEKAEIKKRLLKSPDKADALMLSYAGGASGRFVMDSAKSDTPLEDRPLTSGLLDRKF